MKIAHYPSDLTNEQWSLIKPMVPQPKRTGRPPTDMRTVLNAIFYVAKAGVQWRMLPAHFPPWNTIYGLFRKYGRDHVWENINARLRALVRESEGKRCRPTAAILDSQSVKSDGHGGVVGFDAGKRIKGRKRFVLVDTLGLLLGIHVAPASTPERQGAQDLLTRYLPFLAWLRLMWVDGGFSEDAFALWVKTLRPRLEVEVVKRSDTAKGFKVLARRWVVERTLGWLMRWRRLVRDYERTELSAESWCYIAMIQLQTRRLA